MASKFGGIPVSEAPEQPRSKFGGAPVADNTPAAVPGMELLGGTPPPAAKVPVAAPPMGVDALPDTDRITSHPTQATTGVVNKVRSALLGNRSPVPGAGPKANIPVISDIAGGAPDAVYGAAGVGADFTKDEQSKIAATGSTPGNERARSASRSVRGAMKVGSAALPGAVAAAPLKVAAGLVAGGAAGVGTEAGLKLAGVGDGYAELGGDLAGLGAGAAAAHATPNDLFKADPRVALNRSLRPVPSDPKFAQRSPKALAAIKSANGGVAPVGFTDGMLDVIGAADRAIDTHQAALDNYLARAKGVTVSGDGIVAATQNAIPKLMWVEDPAGAQAIIDQAQATWGGKQFPVEDFRDFLRTGNTNKFYKQSPVAAQGAMTGGTAPAIEAVRTNAIRDALYPALEPETGGAGPREIQQRTGDIYDIRNAGLRRNSAILAEQPLTKFGKFADPLKAGIRAVLPGKATGAGIAYAEGSEGRSLPLLKRAFNAVGDMDPLPQPRGPYPHPQSPARLSLPPGTAPFTQGTSVPDVLGRPDLRTPYNAGLIEQGGSGGGNFTRPNIITPPPADTSFVRGAQGMNAPPFQRKALPPPSTTEVPISPFARPTGETTPPQTGAPNADPSFVRSVPASINPATGKPWTPEELAQYPIPKYARGGVIKHPTLLSDLATGAPTGIMAEAGPEAITPLATPPRAAVTPPSVRLHPHVARSAKQRGAIFEAMRHKGTPPPVRFR